MPHSSQLGARLGPRIVDLVVKGQIQHLRESADVRARIEAQGRHQFWRDIAGERDAHLTGVYDALKDHPDTHPAVERMLGFMSTHQGELAGMLTERTLGQAFGTGIGSGLADLLAPINQRIMQTAPNLTIGLGDAVQAVNAGLWTPDVGQAEAARQGINADRWSVLSELGVQWPDFSTLMELWRRTLVDESYVLLALQRSGFSQQHIAPLLALKQTHLQPADAALMVLRGILTEEQGRVVGYYAGLDPDDFDRLVLATGEPPGPTSLMEALRRGFIDQARFAHGIRQSRIRNEWIDVMTELRYEPMATADAIEAVVRGYLTAPEGANIAQENGLKPDQYHTLLLAHGRPPGHGQMIELLNRGLVSEAQVDQAVRESDIKDKYVPMLKGLRWRIPAERQVISMVQHGAMSTERAHELLLKDGYEPDVANSLVKAGTAQRTAGHKQMALSMVLELYEAHALTQEQAHEHIAALGYPAEDIPLILRTTELKRELRWRDQAITVIHSGYLGHHITVEEAAGELSAAGVSSEQVSHLTRLWAIERKAHRRSLTEAQVIHAMRAGAITQAEALERLQGQGYGPNDALFLIETSGPLPKGA